MFRLQVDKTFLIEVFQGYEKEITNLEGQPLTGFNETRPIERMRSAGIFEHI